ncbi:MAG: HDOD domain-containing protein [Thiohalomonadaceae bacterium]
MHANLADWLDKLERRQLPALPHSAERLAQLARDDNASVPALASVIEKDPGLSVSLVRSTRSLKQRRLTVPVTTVAHAVMLFGITRVREMTAQVPVMDALVNEPAVAARLLALYARANHAAVQAYDWAQLRMDLEPDEVQLTAQLLDLGEMLLWLEAPALMAEVERIAASTGERAQAERAVLGFAVAELTAELAPRWGLPELLQESLKPENAGNPRVAGILLAQELARAAENDWYGAAATHALERIAAYLQMDFPDAVAHVHRTAVAAAHASGGMAALQAAALLLQPARAEASPGAVAGTATPAPNPALYRRALQDLERHGMDLSSIVALTLEAMHEGVGLSRVVFATPGKDRRHLQGRHALGAAEDAVFREFRVPLADDSLFVRLLQKPQAVWISAANRERFTPLLPAEFKAVADDDGFCIVSAFVGERPVGIFYADRRDAGRALDAEAYHQFKQLALAASRAMAHALT